MIAVPLTTGPWQKLAMDIKGTLRVGQHKYLLVVMDYYTKWSEVIGLRKIDSKAIIKALSKIFSTFGLSEQIVSDNRRQFISGTIKKFFKNLRIEHQLVALYSPSQNSLVERFNHVLKEKIVEAVKQNWYVENTILKAV